MQYWWDLFLTPMAPQWLKGEIKMVRTQGYWEEWVDRKKNEKTKKTAVICGGTAEEETGDVYTGETQEAHYVSVRRAINSQEIPMTAYSKPLLYLKRQTDKQIQQNVALSTLHHRQQYLLMGVQISLQHGWGWGRRERCCDAVIRRPAR